MGQFSGKAALVTGAGSGIGRATAIAFAREGAKVVVSNRRADEGQETVRQIKAAGGDALYVGADVSREADVEALVGRAADAFGRLDYAFNNAGASGEPMSVTQGTEADYERLMGANVKGVWLCLKHQIRLMLKQGGGAIVNNASGLGLVGLAGIPLYVASKHAVIGLTKATALEVAKAGVRVNAVCPAIVGDTDMHAAGVGANEQFKQFMLGMHPVGRFGTPAEVANAVVWLCSDGAGFVTGHSLLVDGGYTAH